MPSPRRGGAAYLKKLGKKPYTYIYYAVNLKQTKFHASGQHCSSFPPLHCLVSLKFQPNKSSIQIIQHNMNKTNKKKRSSSQLERYEALAGRVLKDCELCGFQHLCTGVPAPTNNPIPRLRIGVTDNNYICKCKVCKKKYPHPTINVPGENDPLVLPGFSCQSSILIYGFFCTLCQKIVYVGKTTQQLRARISTHTSAGNYLVRDHERLHKNAIQLVILEAWSNGAGLNALLKTRECHWTTKFRTLESDNNGGLQKYKAHGSRCTSC